MRYTNLWLLIPGILLLVAIVVLGWRERPVSIFAASALGLLSATGFYSISLDTEQLAPSIAPKHTEGALGGQTRPSKTKACSLH